MKKLKVNVVIRWNMEKYLITGMILVTMTFLIVRIGIYLVT